MKSRKKIIHENVLKTYKKADMSLPKKISKKTKKLEKPLMSLIDLISWQNKSALSL